MIRAASDLHQIKNNICDMEDIILAEVCSNGEVDLNAFCDLVDLYTYLPKKKSKYAAGSLSPNIFRVLSSNIQDQASAADLHEPLDQGLIKRQLEVIAVRLNERFHKLNEAFRFFDVNFKNQITFNEFAKGLETLKVKVSLKDQYRCFKYLDSEEKGFVTYHDFCNLTDERRRQIDPAKKMVDEYMQKQKQQDPF